MAKRKKRKTGGSSRRSGRRVGGMGGGSFTPVLSAIGGAFIAKFAQSWFKTLEPKIMGLIQLAVGFVMTRTKWPIIQGLGIGFTVVGGMGLAQSFGLISGIGAIGRPIVFQSRRMSGYNQVQNLAGTSNPYPKPAAVGQRKAADMNRAYAASYGRRP